MMNDVIFRAKRKDNGEWVEGSLVRYANNYNEIISYQSIEEHEYHIINQSIAMYTGLKDNTKWKELTEQEQKEWLKTNTKEQWDGKRIFGSIPIDGRISKGGDILEAKNPLESIVKHRPVTFKNGSFWFGGIAAHTYIECYKKVIGNQTDNPELLNNEEK